MLGRNNYGRSGTGRIVITELFSGQRSSQCVEACLNLREFIRIRAGPMCSGG